MTIVTTAPKANKVPMGIRVNKDGRIVKTTVKVKDIVLYAELDFPLLCYAAIMMSILNILYIMNTF